MAATAQFLTPTITKLELLAGGKVIASATGFFLKHGNNWAIATNWHVLSGRNPVGGQPRHPSGAVPEVCAYLAFEIVDERLVASRRMVSLGDALLGSATWLQHPTEGQDVDIAILPIRDGRVGLAKDLYEPGAYDPDMLIDVGAELFIPGYPLGLAAPGGFAIWKRASLATSLELGEGVDRYCYVDTATREGMSGAPCLAISNWRHYRLNRETGQVAVINEPMSHRLIGVYSGRRNPSDNFEAQIGTVWRESLLRAILINGVPASVALR